VRAVIIDVLLAVTVVGEAACVLGIFASATLYERLHFGGATASVPPFLVFVAILLKQKHPYTIPVWNALFVAVVLFLLTAVLTHAIARVARQRELHDVEL
jgi:multisubunit Na+/H+ antiporter MnhG subunit